MGPVHDAHEPGTSEDVRANLEIPGGGSDPALEGVGETWRYPIALALGIAALLTLIVALGSSAVFFLREQQAAGVWVQHTREVIDTIYRVRMQVTDLESGKRGFLLTQDPEYLHPFGVYPDDVRNSLADLKQLVAGNADQFDLALALGTAVEAKLQEIEKVLQTARTSGTNDAIAIMEQPDVRPLMGQVRAQAAAMVQTERDLLLRRMSRARQLRTRAIWLNAAMVGFTLVIAALGAKLARDETDWRRRQALALKQAHDKTAEANLSKTRFLAGAGHDLKQSLQAIMLVSGSLERRYGPAVHTAVNRIECAVETMSQVFDQFTEAARLASGAMKPHPVLIEIDVLLTELCRHLRPIAEAKGLTLKCVRTTAQAYADPDMLATILRNLIGNAIKYTRNGGIVVGVRRRGGNIAIEVHDSGIGIPADKLDVVFKEFHQLSADASAGVGLGLSIVKGTAELLGCTITVRSRFGAGSCFSVDGLLCLPDGVDLE